MEAEKSKKKRNKKKKNNNNGQNKALDEISEDQSQASTEIKDVESQGKESDDACLNGNGSNGLNSAIIVESEKQQWIQKEATLEEMIRQLQAQKNSDSKKEATLVGTVNQLHEENNLHLQKEFAYEETIKQLREENNSYYQKEANLEMKIGQLQREKDSWVQKESQFEERIRQLVDEKITWNLKEESLEDRIRHLEVEKRSLILKEDSNKVMISNLGDDIAVLRARVPELEKSRNYLLNENRKLLENISSLQLQIKDIQTIASEQSLPELTKLASERDELSSQIESAFAFVERLMEENAELVEKVSELLIQLDRHRGSYPRPSTLAPEPIIEAVKTAGLSHSVAEIGHESNLNSIEIVPVREERNEVNYTGIDHFAEETSEIVQIPLDENDVSDLELQVSERIGEEEEATSFTDAPMIGAPFRLISFVSRYVSGADLVEKNSLKV